MLLGIVLLLLFIFVCLSKQKEDFSALSYQDKRDLVYCDYRPWEYEPGECDYLRNRIYNKAKPVYVGVLVGEHTKPLKLYEQVDPSTSKVRYLIRRNGMWQSILETFIKLHNGDNINIQKRKYYFQKQGRWFLPYRSQLIGYLVRKRPSRKIPRNYRVFSVRTANNRTRLYVKHKGLHFPLDRYDEDAILSFGEIVFIHGQEYRFVPFTFF